MNKILCVRNIILSCLVCCLLILPVIVHAAAMTYKYTGNYFTDFLNNSSPPPGEYTTNMRVAVELTTNDGFLIDSAAVTSISSQLSSWMFSDGRQVLSSSGGASLFWDVASVSGGNIVSWNLQALYSDPGYPAQDTYARSIFTDTTPGHVYDDAGITIGLGGGATEFDAAYNNNNPGSWVVSASPVPEPTTMLLLGVGLAGIAGFGRKKFKK